MVAKTILLNNTLSELPDFVFDFVKKYYDGESVNTQIAYAIDIRTYLKYLMRLSPFKNEVNVIEDFTPAHLEKVDLNTLLDYKVYLERYENTYTTNDGIEKTVILTNSKKGILRKLSTLRTLYSYLFKADLIDRNITEKLDLPKIHHKMKKPLTFQETLKIIDVIYNGEKYFKGRELALYKKKKQRDITIFSTLLGTGIRVSEMIGLNIEDIDFENSSFVVLRKGGDNQEIYMPVQVENELHLYIQERMEFPNAKDKKALFLSNRGTRITVSSIEKMVKKYCNIAGVYNPDKTTVHALRRTFACNLLEEGIDLKMVAELLGHRDISVTAKFYAQHNKASHRKVMQSVKLPTDTIEETLNSLNTEIAVQ